MRLSSRWKQHCQEDLHALRVLAGRVIFPVLAFSIVCSLNAGLLSAHAQMSSGSALPQLPSARSSDGRDADFPRNAEFERKQQRAREVERQKRIVDDTRRLVEMSEQYRKAIETHSTATAEDEKLLLQMEKLARDIRDRLRGM